MQGLNDQNTNGAIGRNLIVTVWYKGKITDEKRDEVINSIAKTVFENARNIDDFTGIQIKLMSAYDIGISSGNFFMYSSYTIQDWRKEIFPNESS